MNTLKPQLHFSMIELAKRRQRALSMMTDNHLEGCLLFRQESMYYLTGYDTFGYVFFQCLYLHHDGRMTLLTRSADWRQAQLTSMIDDIRIWEDCEGANPADDLLAIIREYGVQGRLGVEWDSYGLTAKNGRLLDATLKNYELVDWSTAISTLRVIKSDAEICYVKKAAAAADKALTAAVDATHAGAFEGDILANLQGEIFRCGGEYSGNEFIIGSGERALLCRSYAGRRTLSQDDQLTLEFAGSYCHYHAAMMRTILIGKPCQRHKDMHSVAVDAFAAAKDALKPQQAIGQVFDEYARVVDAAGMKACRLNATGYSLGTTFAPNWMDYPMFYHGNSFIAEKNMIFFIHIILMDSDRGLAMSTGETVLVGESSAVGLSMHNHDLILR